MSDISPNRSTISSPVTITSSVVDVPASYEVQHGSGGAILALKRFKDFSMTARTIAAADSEYGWTWDNRAEVSSANENTSTASAAHFVAANTTSDWFGATFTAARRYKTFTFSTQSILKPLTLISRISNNASTNYTGFGIQITDASDDTNFARYQIGFAAAAQKIISYVGATPQETACTAQNLTDGIWLKMTFFNGTVVFDYNLGTDTTPPTTGWVRDRSTSFALDIAKTYQVGLIQIVNAATSGLVSKVHYYDDSGLANALGEDLNPFFCAQGFDATLPQVGLCRDFDVGSAVPEINATKLNDELLDSFNVYQESGYDSAAWTFSAWRASTTVGDVLQGTATSGGASTMTDSGRSWTTNGLAGLNLSIVAGTGSGQSKAIISNTGTTITTSAWVTPPDSTSKYEISTGTFQNILSVTLSGSGRYFNMVAKCNSSGSTGTESGSLLLPLNFPLTVS